MARANLTLAAALAATLIGSGAAAADNGSKTQFAPTLLSADSGETVLGLTYQLENKVLRDFAAPQVAADGDGWEDPDIDALEWGYTLKGVMTSNPDDNPENFVELDLYLNYTKIALDSPVQEFGAVYKYESDQSFDNKQSLLGLRYTAHINRLVPDTYRTSGDFLLRATLGEVNPRADAAREAALGSPLERYNRWDAIALYKLPVRDYLGNFAEDLEISYRYFEEVDAPDAIRAAGLDNFDYLSVVLNLQNNLFVAYTDGELPLDLETDKTFKLGWSWDLGALGN